MEWLRGRTAQDRTWPRRLKRYAIVVIPAGVLFSLLFLGVAYALVRIPEPNDISSARSTRILDRTGHVIARLHAEADRVDVPFAEMPKHLRAAVVAVEDHDFYTHGGVSLPSIVRAAFANLTGFGVKQGGSTITQQYVKNAYVGRERTIWRKIKEAIVSIKVERKRSKDEILADYLNTIYFGRGAYGVEAAARTYFGLAAKSISVDQAALLAGLIKGPELYDPVRNPERAKERRDTVIRAMQRYGFLDAAGASKALASPVKVKERSAVDAPAAVGAHFVEDVRRALVRSFGSDRVYRGGLIVRTTLDLKMQKYAEEAVASVLDRKDDPQAALVSIDTETGGVLAMVGGRSFSETQFNLATQGHRQPGSSFKPFVLASGLEDGLSVRSRFDAPASITLRTGFEPWKVTNYDRKDYGEIDLIEATEFSVNTVYAQLILKVGPRNVADLAEKMGIATKLDPVPSLTLGTSPVTPMELTGSYAAFATGGMHVAPHLIVNVQDANKHTIFATEIKKERVVEEKVANTVAYALTQVVQKGTGRRAALGSRPVGAKTGTTENHVDAWFVGFTRQVATAVWMGFPESSERTMEHVRGIAVTGGSFPAQIWKAYMEKAVDGMPVESFGAPSYGGETLSPSPSPSPTPSPTSSHIVLPPSLTPTPTPTETHPNPSPSPSGSGTGGGGG
jgi:penicillin-binding protein 1A